MSVLLAIGLCVLTGCGTDDSGAPASSTTPPASNAPSSGPSIPPSETPGTPPATASRQPTAVAESLKFTSTTVDGKTFDGASLAGKPTVLWFWAPWCPKCRAQAAETAKVAADYQGRINFVGVAGLDKTPKMRDFVADHKLSGFPQLSDENGDVWKRFEIVEQSTYVLLDANGKPVQRGVFPEGDGLAEKVATLTS